MKRVFGTHLAIGVGMRTTLKDESRTGAPSGRRLWRRLTPVSLKTYGAMLHFEIGIVLISIIPFLTAIYAAGLGEGSWAGANRLTLTGLILSGCLLAPAVGYTLLVRYPRMVVRLRHYLTEIVRGEMPERITVVHEECDLAAIEEAMNLILQKLKVEVSRVTDANAHVQAELMRVGNRAVGTLAGGIANEINTPLQIIRCQSECALQAVDRLIAAMVKAMQSFARQGADEARNPIDLNEAIENAVTITRNEWKCVADLATFLDPDLPAVPCYSGEIRQAVATLITNGARAIAERGNGSRQAKGRIMITTRGAGATVEIKVSDNGVGIPPALCDRIFDPCFTMPAGGQGVGQGLAILHATVVDRHGGCVQLDTTEGQGSTFTIALPVDADRKE